MVKSLGENIAIYDNKIKHILTNIINNKEEVINEYKKLKQILPEYDESRKKTAEKLLNARKQEFEHTLDFKNKQNEALLKLLEYLNSLEKKEKNLHIRRTLDKMKKIDNEITLLNNLITKV
jgi:hypothetical protein